MTETSAVHDVNAVELAQLDRWWSQDWWLARFGNG